MEKNRVFWAALSLAFLLLVSSSNAGLQDVQCADDGDGVIGMGVLDWGPDGSEYYVDISCSQNEFDAGHLDGDFTTDGDPIIWIIETIENNTDFVWTDYHIAIGLKQDFDIITAMAPDTGWDIEIIQPILGTLPTHTDPEAGYVGYINFDVGDSGTSVGIGEEGDFGFKIAFDFIGEVRFCTEQVPTPEPATLLLLGMGGSVLLRKRRV